MDIRDFKELCACCGKAMVGFYDFCQVCGWQHDEVQNEQPDFDGGANEMSLNEAKKAYAEGRKVY